MRASLKFTAGAWVAASVLQATGSPAAAADCAGYALTIAQTGGDAYDATAPGPTIVSLRLISATGPLPAACADAPVRIVAAGSQPFPMRLADGTRTLAVDYSADAVASRSGQEVVLSATARARLAAGQDAVVRFADIRPGQYERAGLYTSQIEVRAGDQVAPFTVQTRAVPVMRFEKDFADGVETVELGELSEGARRQVTMMYRSSADLDVTVRSDNRGALVHEGGEEIGRIPYQAELDGTPLVLQGGEARLSMVYGGAQLQSRRLRFIVPAQTRLPAAGRYTDVLTVSFTPF